MDRTRAHITLACALLSFLVACDWPARWLARNQREIDDLTGAISAAGDDASRAQGLSARGRAFSERARYSRVVLRISAEESGHLFDRAMQDHDRAVTLAPGDLRVHLDRGLTLHARASLEEPEDPRTRALLDAASADFTAVLDQDGRHEQALDMRGIVFLQAGDFDRAIDDFTVEMDINPKLGKSRLADAHCSRASEHQKKSETELAIADYERAIEFGAPTDGCACQPHSALAWLYLESQQVDKSRDVVRRARASRRWIAPEIVDRLEGS